MRRLIFLVEREEDHLPTMMNNFEIGIDEVGRGSIFGPVFAAIVKVSPNNALLLRGLGINDSKKLSSKKREGLISQIKELSEDWGLGQSSVREIDRYGIRFATELSIIRAIYKLKSNPCHILIDGSLPIRLWDGPQTSIIKGDSKFVSISAASILAKVSRDSLMNRLDNKYKGYMIYKNKGYGTKDHFLSLKKKGITKLHRKTFLKKLNII